NNKRTCDYRLGAKSAEGSDSFKFLPEHLSQCKDAVTKTKSLVAIIEGSHRVMAEGWHAESGDVNVVVRRLDHVRQPQLLPIRLVRRMMICDGFLNRLRQLPFFQDGARDFRVTRANQVCLAVVCRIIRIDFAQ